MIASLLPVMCYLNEFGTEIVNGILDNPGAAAGDVVEQGAHRVLDLSRTARRRAPHAGRVVGGAPRPSARDVRLPPLLNRKGRARRTGDDGGGINRRT